MSLEQIRERVIGLHQEARKEAGRGGGAEPDSSGRRPQPGDLFVVTGSADGYFEWAILEEDQRGRGRYYAVPADTGSFVGSADVAASKGSTGPLTLRCGFGLWLPVEAFAADSRTGRLDPSVTAEALRKAEAAESGTLRARPLEEEVDASAHYRELEKNLDQERTAVRSRWPPGTRRGLVPVGLLKTAASILLPLAVLAVAGYLWHMRAVDRLEADHAAADAAASRRLEELRAAGEQAAGRHREQLQRLNEKFLSSTEESRRETKELRRQLAEARRPRPLENLPFIAFGEEDRIRGGEVPGIVHKLAPAPMVVLIVPVSKSHLYGRFRLEVVRNTGEPVWSSDGLILTGVSELSVGLPRVLLTKGSYRLRCFGLAGDQSTLLDEFFLHIEGS